MYQERGNLPQLPRRRHRKVPCSSSSLWRRGDTSKPLGVPVTSVPAPDRPAQQHHAPQQRHRRPSPEALIARRKASSIAAVTRSQHGPDRRGQAHDQKKRGIGAAAVKHAPCLCCRTATTGHLRITRAWRAHRSCPWDATAPSAGRNRCSAAVERNCSRGPRAHLGAGTRAGDVKGGLEGAQEGSRSKTGGVWRANAQSQSEIPQTACGRSVARRREASLPKIHARIGPQISRRPGIAS